MRPPLVCLLVALLLLPAVGSAAVLGEWDFTRLNTGWRDEAGSVPQLGPAGTLWPGAAGGVSVRSPALSIPAAAFQAVEIAVSFEQPGQAHLLWRGEAFGRSSSGWQGPLPVQAPADGQVHLLRLLPFWQNVKVIEGLRLVAPPGTRLRLKTLRLTGQDLPPGDHTSWDLTSPAQAGQWLPLSGGATLTGTPEGLRVALSQPTVLLVSAPLDLPAFRYEWLSARLTAAAAGQVRVQWACSGQRGLHGPSFALRPGTHTYNVRCAAEKSWAGQGRGLALELAGAAGTAVTIEAMTLASEPQGAADLRSLYAGPLEPRLRQGRAFRLAWALQNEGGLEAREVKVTALPSAGVTLPEGPLAVARMDHGVPEVLTWLATASGPATVVLQAEYAGRVLREEVRLTPEQSPAPTEPLPPPVALAVPGVAVAAHYHTPPAACYGPGALDRMLYRRPYLGDYEVTPAALEWQLRWSLEHGLNTWILDLGTPEDEATLDAFLGTRSARQMQFCLRWTAPVPTSSAGRELLAAQLAPVLAQPNYLRLQDKPAVLVASALRRTDEGFGLSDLSELAAAMPVTLLACAPLEAAGADLLHKAGYAAAVDLHTDEAFPRSPTPLQDWQAAAEAGTPHALCLQPAWQEAMVPARLQALLGVALLRARKTDPCALPLVIAGDLNAEVSLEPRRPDGFQWLRAIAAAAGATAVPEFAPVDLGRADFSRRYPAPPSSWEFDTKDTWNSAMGLSVLRIADGLLTGRTDSAEPAIFGGETLLNTQSCSAVLLAMSASEGTEGRLYWRTSLRKFARDNSLAFKLAADGAIHEYRLEVGRCPGWRGYLEGLRLDPTNAAGATIAIDYLRLVP